MYTPNMPNENNDTEEKKGLPGLRAAMDRKNLSLSQLSHLVGTTSTTLSRLANKKAGASTDFLEKLADKLETTTDQLLGRTPPASSEASA